VILLRDIRRIFDTRGIDRIHGKVLLAALHELEDADWSEFCGFKSDDRTPRSVWPQKGQTGDRSGKGYHRSDFEAAWQAYCREEKKRQTGKCRSFKGFVDHDLPVCRFSGTRAYELPTPRLGDNAGSPRPSPADRHRCHARSGTTFVARPSTAAMTWSAHKVSAAAISP
jgi:hypothetical protein